MREKARTAAGGGRSARDESLITNRESLILESRIIESSNHRIVESRITGFETG
jgi:hypothetical protein